MIELGNEDDAVMIELGNEDDAVIRCGLEASRLFFRLMAQISTGAYKYRY